MILRSLDQSPVLSNMTPPAVEVVPQKRAGRCHAAEVTGRPEYPLRNQETPHYLKRFKFCHDGVDVYFREDDVPLESSNKSAMLAVAESPECSDSEMDMSGSVAGGGGRPTSPLKRASVQLEDVKVPSAKKAHTFGGTASESDDAEMMNTDEGMILPSPSASPITSDVPLCFDDKVSPQMTATLDAIPGLVSTFDTLPEPIKK
jgi:hypothetical protein